MPSRSISSNNLNIFIYIRIISAYEQRIELSKLASANVQLAEDLQTAVAGLATLSVLLMHRQRCQRQGLCAADLSEQEQLQLGFNSSLIP